MVAGRNASCRRGVSGPITIFDAATGKPAHQLKGHGFGTASIAWQPGGNLIASVGQDRQGSSLGCNDGTGIERRSTPAHLGREARLAPVGSMARDRRGQEGARLDVSRRARPRTASAGRHSDGPRVAAGNQPPHAFSPTAPPRPTTRLLESTPVKLLAWKGSPLAMAWSPDGKILAHGNQDATVHFWYYDSSHDLQMWGYRTKIRELAWDYSSRYLATGGSPVVCIWDCQAGPKGPEGSKPQMLEGHEENI